MKKLNFLLIPKSNYFMDLIILMDIGNEIKKNGHNCINLTAPISDENLYFLLKQKKIDVVLGVNKGKPERLKKNIRFISWLTDIYSSEELNNFNENDIIYTLKKSKIESKKIKIKHLIPAANVFSKIKTVSDYDFFSGDSNFQEIDFSVVNTLSKNKLFDGNKNKIYDGHKKNMENHKFIYQLFKSLKKEYKISVFGTMDYSKVFKDNLITYKGEVNNLNYFYEIFRNSKFNLTFDHNYLDFNSNFFNILLVEGTLIANDKFNNIIKNYLEQDQDFTNCYISYENTESFQSKISEFYDDFERRLIMGKKASIFVNNNHTYKNRVNQILMDLI